MLRLFSLRNLALYLVLRILFPILLNHVLFISLHVLGTYNYNLAKYLCSLLKPHISSEFCATDTFSFVKDIQDGDFRDVFMVSYDVASLFTNIPLSETIDLAVNAIFESNTGLDLKLGKTELKELLNFATSHTHF